MNDFEIIDKAIGILYIQDDLLSIFSLIKALGKDGESKYETIEDNLNKFIQALKKLNPINLGDKSSSITLEKLLEQLENSRTRPKALILLQKHHQQLVSEINIQAAMKQKNTTIDGLGIIMYGYSLITSVYGARSLAPLLKAVHTLANDKNGYTYALEYLQNSENAPYYLYNLLMPTDVINDEQQSEKQFFDRIDEHYQKSKMHKKIASNLKKKKLENAYYYEMLYWVFSYFADFEHYKEAHNKLAAQTRDSEKYYIISKDLYVDFPKPIQEAIDERLKAVLISAENTQNKANKYFKELEEIKVHAEALRSHKRQKLNVGLKQAILMSKLNLAVAMLHELGTRLSRLDIEIKKNLTLPKETVVNTRKLPRFTQWCESLDQFISGLNNKRDSFSCLVYHRIMSAILTKYDDLSKIYDEIYKDTAYDDKAIRGIVQEKAKMIANIQMNPLRLLEDVCRTNSIEDGDKKAITSLFINSHSQIIPITENCLEEFSYAAQLSPDRQYQLALKQTNRHPLYPLITIYSEWYKLRAFILFFENFGNSNSSYLRSFEKTNGVAFEFLYKDLVYLSYAFGTMYNELEQSAQSMVLKYITIFSIAPNNPNYHLAFKKFAILSASIFSHSTFSKSSFSTMLNDYIKHEELNVSSRFNSFLRNSNENRTGFSISAVDSNFCTLSYQANRSNQFEIVVTSDEYRETLVEIEQLYELGGRAALTAIAMIVALKNYNDNFIVETLPNIELFKGFYTTDIFKSWRRAGIKKLDKTLRLVNLDDNYKQLIDLSKKLESYSTSKEDKILANNFVKTHCQTLIRYFKEDTNLDLDQLKRIIDAIDQMLQTKAITKATGKSTCKENLIQAKSVFSNIYQKLVYVDICCFSQYSITALKPFKPNRGFIDMMAHYLSKTFVRNEEVVVTRCADLGKIEGLSKPENQSLDIVPFKAEDRVVFKPSYENDRQILGIIHDSESGREIVPKDITNKFYVFLKMMTKMCEYYMDSIISIFGENYDKRDYSRFDKFLDKLLEDFQIAINTDFKTTHLDEMISQFKLNSSIVNLYVVFTLNANTEGFKENNYLDLLYLEKFIEESISNLNIRSFDKVKFFDSSYREFSLIKNFRKVYDELESTFNFMQGNKDFIILSHSDLFDIYDIKDDKQLQNLIKNTDNQKSKTLRAIFDDERTKTFKLKDLKDAVDAYELYLTKHIIFPEYNENTVLACGLLCYEYNQIITIIYQDFLDNANEYYGRYDFKWWHVASLGFGAAIDYFYTRNNLAKGIKEIQTVIDNQEDTNHQIEQIIKIANHRLQKNSKRKDNVRLLYNFLSNDLSKYVERKKQLSEKYAKANFNFTRVSEADEGSFDQYRSYLAKPRSASNLKPVNPVNEISVEIDPNDPRVIAISQNLAPLNLLTTELRDSVAIDIVSDITSHRINRASMISNGFIDICIGKRHLDAIVELNRDNRFLIKPCRTLLSNVIVQGDILADINRLIETSINSLILLPINHGNWHFTLLIIDTANHQVFFFDSFGAGREEWIQANLIRKLTSLRGWGSTNLTTNFQYNNDCGFLVLSFIDQIYQLNNTNMNIAELHASIIQQYDRGQQSGFIRQYFCNFAGEPFSANSWIFNYDEREAI